MGLINRMVARLRGGYICRICGDFTKEWCMLHGQHLCPVCYADWCDERSWATGDVGRDTGGQPSDLGLFIHDMGGR